MAGAGVLLVGVMCGEQQGKRKCSVSVCSGSKGNLGESCCSSISFTSGVLLTLLPSET